MAHTSYSQHGEPASNEQMIFPAQEWALLQAEDRQAARNIVVLMTSVFTLGLCGYLIVAYIVGS